MIQITLTLPENHPFCVQLLAGLMTGTPVGTAPVQLPSETPKPQRVAPKPKLAEPEPQVQAPAGPPVPELDKIKDAVRQLISVHNGTTDELEKLFTQFKISRVSDLPDNKRATFLAAVQAATKVA
jgi:hypothetical protein